MAPMGNPPMFFGKNWLLKAIAFLLGSVLWILGLKQPAVQKQPLVLMAF